jgi:hypothetical protein
VIPTWRWLSLAVVFAAGCGELKSGIRPDEKLSADHAYIYGRFFITAPPVALGMAGHQSIGLVLLCVDGQQYRIWFSEKRDVQVIKVLPGRCAVDEVEFTDADGRVLGRIHPRRPASNNQDFAPGVAHYLGDFHASGNSESKFKGLYSEARWTWMVVPVHGQYELTTAEMRRTFPSVATAPTENRELISESAGERAQSALTDDAVRPRQ